MAHKFLAGLRALLIDLDGVTYRGSMTLPGAREVVPTLRRLGIARCFVTNNATLGPEQVAEKLLGMGVEATAEEVVTSGGATATYLRKIAAPGARICAIGEEGLLHVLRETGFELQDEGAEFVVVSLDRRLTYQRLVAACLAIQRGARLIATNADRSYPVEGGLWPGAGAIVAAISTAMGVEPTVIGKPQPTLLQIAMERLGAQPSATAIVGDVPESDIRAGKAAGIWTVLVKADPAQTASALTLSPSLRQAQGRLGSGQALSKGVMPDLVVRDLGELLRLLEQAKAAHPESKAAHPEPKAAHPEPVEG